jgi:ABC-type dipeptide/oligopeptide/nickel transport system permease component
MWIYILKRIFLFIPSLFIITLLAFIISIKAPGDPVQRILSSAEQDGSQQSSKLDINKAAKELRVKMGLDLPAFYFSLETAADIDTINLILENSHHEKLKRLVLESLKRLDSSITKLVNTNLSETLQSQATFSRFIR